MSQSKLCDRHSEDEIEGCSHCLIEKLQEQADYYQGKANRVVDEALEGFDGALDDTFWLEEAEPGVYEFGTAEEPIGKMVMDGEGYHRFEPYRGWQTELSANILERVAAVLNRLDAPIVAAQKRESQRASSTREVLDEVFKG